MNYSFNKEEMEKEGKFGTRTQNQH